MLLDESQNTSTQRWAVLESLVGEILFVGLHVHAGSGVPSPGHWRQMGRFLLSLVEAFPDVRVLDRGWTVGMDALAAVAACPAARVESFILPLRKGWLKD